MEKQIGKGGVSNGPEILNLLISFFNFKFPADGLSHALL
jgi:hypothetical protein